MLSATIFVKFKNLQSALLSFQTTMVRDFFDHLGFVVCEPNEQMTSLDQALEIGLEVGAEEVESVDLSDSETLFQFQCHPRDIQVVTKALEGTGARIVQSEDRYVPKDLVKITADTYKTMEEMYKKVRENCDAVDRVFDNVEVS